MTGSTAGASVIFILVNKTYYTSGAAHAHNGYASAGNMSGARFVSTPDLIR